ncbi:hypothetical protein [Rhodococcus sp. NPDC058514]|uniref:hypothetical protein n=1 Tax=unclassified Rhodococcus (in: high G+C Gram-positive bacteria) TaxID=192944 RepID=UPI003656886A
MSEINKKTLKESEIRNRYITPAIVRAAWALGECVVLGKLHGQLLAGQALRRELVAAFDTRIISVGEGNSAA